MATRINTKNEGMDSSVGLNLGTIIDVLMKEKHMDAYDLAYKCKCTHQTIQNILKGKSTSGKVASKLIEALDLMNDKKTLRRFLLAFLQAQFSGDGRPEQLTNAKNLLEKAGLS